MESCTNEVWKFILSGYLPTIAECMQAIYSVSATEGSDKQNDAINDFCAILKEQWEKAFGPKYVKHRTTIKRKITKHVTEYNSQVLKKKGNRNVNMRRWARENNKLFCILNDVDAVEKFDEPERLFYEDQSKLIRKRFLSGEEDQKYVFEEEQRIQELQLNEEAEKVELECALGDPDVSEMNNASVSDWSSPNVDGNLNFSVLRTGKIRKTEVVGAVACQTE